MARKIIAANGTPIKMLRSTIVTACVTQHQMVIEGLVSSDSTADSKKLRVGEQNIPYLLAYSRCSGYSIANNCIRTECSVRL